MSIDQDYAFIRGTFVSDNDSRKAIKSLINRAQNEFKDCNFGVLNEKGDKPVLFCTKRQGLMPGATIYHEVVQYGNSLTMTLFDEQCYLMFIKDGDVIYEDIVSLTNLSEAQTNSLKLHLFQLGADAYLICNKQPDEVTDFGVTFEDKIDLPFGRNNVVVKENLNSLFSSTNLLSSVEYKQLTLDGEIIKRKWAFSAGSIIAAIFVIGWVNHQVYSVEEESSVSTSGLKRVVQTLTEEVISQQSAQQALPDYSGLVDWYTKESVQPKPVLDALSKDMRLFQSIEGWDVIKATFKIESGVPHFVIMLEESEGADIQSVTNVAVRGGWKLSFKDKVFTVFKTVDTLPLFRNAGRFHYPSYEKYISTALKDWWDETSFDATDLAAPKTNQASSGDTNEELPPTISSPFSKRLLKITKTDYTSYDLHSFGALLAGHPYSLQHVELSKEGHSFDEEPKRQTRRNEFQNPNANIKQDLFKGFDVTYELVLAGVNTR